MNETIVYHGITFHLIPGQKPCFQYDIENAVYTGYIDPDIDMDSLMELLDAIEEDKRQRYEAIPPNILKLALHMRRKGIDPKVGTEMLCALLKVVGTDE